MNDLLTVILKNITTKPDGVNISMEMEGDVEVYTIQVDPEDVGRVIGKSGKIIRAIRSLAHVSAVHNQKRVRIHLDDGSPQDQATPQEAPQEAINEAVAETAPTETPVEVEAPEETPEAPAEAEAPAETPVEVEAPEEIPEAPAEAEAPAETPVEVEAPAVEDLLPEEPAK